jgi:hypothetical protein
MQPRAFKRIYYNSYIELRYVEQALPKLTWNTNHWDQELLDV